MDILDTKALNNGTLLFKKYTIVKLLGKGNFSFVYLVKEKNDKKRHFVVKEFFPHEYLKRKENNKKIKKKTLTSSKIDEFKKLKVIFQNESKNLKKITMTKHSGVTNFISFHQNVNNTSYIVTDYIKTTPLQNHLKTLHSPRLLSKFLKELLLVIEHIHHFKIYHQDIKIENILIKEDLTPLIIDFGASTILYDKKSGKYLNTTSSNSAAIEQLSLNYPPEINESTDIYSIAAVIYKILTGNYPINSKTRERCVEQGKEDPYVPLSSKALPLFDKHTLYCIDKALSLYQEERYANTKAFRLALKKPTLWLKVKNILLK